MSDSALETLTIFYTHNLRGDLQRLPRLYTFMQRLKQQHAPKPLILDTGHACSDAVWHCEYTGGRSTLIVLDGMGYHAVNVADYLQPGERYKLNNVISAGMVDSAHNWRYNVPPVRDEGIVVAGQETPALRLCVVAAAADATRLQQGTLYLAGLDAFQVGIVSLDLQGSPSLTASEVVTMPDGLPPDATIAASVEFVEDEARFLRRKQS